MSSSIEVCMVSSSSSGASSGFSSMIVAIAKSLSWFLLSHSYVFL